MRKTAEVVIIGGGVHGCSIAYHLARQGCREVVLLEKETLASGGTGRSAAGIRHQFGTEVNIRLATASVRMMETLAEDLKYAPGIELKQGGYLMLAYSEGTLDQLRRNVELQHSLDLGIPSRILNPDEVKEIVPHLNMEGIIGASYCHKDGHVNPFHVTQAFAEAAARLGVEINTFTEVTGIKMQGHKVTGVVTNRGEISCSKVVNAAGPYGAVIGKMVGLDIPLYPERHQILVTEPLEEFLGPMVISFQHGTYFKQTPHGSLLMGVGDPLHEVKEFNQKSTWQFLEDVAKKITYHLPALKNVRIVRQWSGLYDITPDYQAILGATPKVEGFYLDIGWSGHGLQLGPVVGRVMSEIILGKEPFVNVDVMRLERFETGELYPEPACV
ncbi:MAG: NAD(P)/FAD-dependent oxidoreductase [Bacillota bacterium]